MPRDYLLVMNTCPTVEAAQKLALLLVENNLAACVNIIPGLTSIYRWQGKLNNDQEVLLLIKSTAEHYAAMEKLLRDNHPYELPEIIAVPVTRGLPEYLDWISQTTGAP